MKMPSKEIDPVMFAPCGMNCMVCYKHCYHKSPCQGCFKNDEAKPKHCRSCKIRDCTIEKGLSFCYRCTDFPCKLIKNLERSYNKRYGVSLIHNSKTVKARGIIAFMKKQKTDYTCPVCGGIISVHDAECSECQRKIIRREIER